MIARNSAKRSGFSLLELSIVLAIMATVTVLGLEAAAQIASRRAYTVTEQKLKALDEALVKFYGVYGRLPCPATWADALARTPADGLESNACVPSAATNQVVFGTFPYRTLNLQRTQVIDGYGNQINYAVSRWLAIDPFTGGTNNFNMQDARIEVRTGRLQQPCTTLCSVVANPTTRGGAAYVVYSAGADGKDAISMTGLDRNPCLTPLVTIDKQNCRRNGTLPLAATLGAQAATEVFYDSRFNNGSEPDSFFDDLIVWRTKARLM